MKLPTLVLFFLLEVFLFLLGKLRKRCHKFTLILQWSQSDVQGDFNSSITTSFPIWLDRYLNNANNVINKGFIPCLDFLWLVRRFSLKAASKNFFGRSHIYNVSSTPLSWSSYSTSFLYFSYIILFALHFSFRTTYSS